jgi:hypothetical protein
VQADAVFDQTLNAMHRQPAVVRNIGGFGSPRRHRSQARRNDDGMLFHRALVGVAVGEQGREFFNERGIGRSIGSDKVDKSRRDTGNFVVNTLQNGQKLLNTKIGQGVTAFKMGDVLLGHGVNLEREKEKKRKENGKVYALHSLH